MTAPLNAALPVGYPRLARSRISDYRLLSGLSFSSKRGNREGNRTLREVFPLYSVSI